jgi:hypothetical protein
MMALLRRRFFGSKIDQKPASFPRISTVGSEMDDSAGEVPAGLAQAIPEPMPAQEETTMLRTIAWISAGLGAVALGLVVGRELRQRYKFNRRTPYDFYAHSGDEIQDMEFGVGI